MFVRLPCSRNVPTPHCCTLQQVAAVNSEKKKEMNARLSVRSNARCAVMKRRCANLKLHTAKAVSPDLRPQPLLHLTAASADNDTIWRTAGKMLH